MRLCARGGLSARHWLSGRKGAGTISTPRTEESILKGQRKERKINKGNEKKRKRKINKRGSCNNFKQSVSLNCANNNSASVWSVRRWWTWIPITSAPFTPPRDGGDRIKGRIFIYLWKNIHAFLQFFVRSLNAGWKWGTMGFFRVYGAQMSDFDFFFVRFWNKSSK